MAAEPRARYNLRSRSQSGKVESKEVKLPHLRKPKDKLIGHQGKDESPKNNGNKFPNTYLEDKRTVRVSLKWRRRKSLKGGKRSYYYPHIEVPTLMEDTYVHM